MNDCLYKYVSATYQRKQKSISFDYSIKSKDNWLSTGLRQSSDNREYASFHLGKCFFRMRTLLKDYNLCNQKRLANSNLPLNPL